MGEAVQRALRAAEVALEQARGAASLGVSERLEGYVESVADGVVRISGLKDAAYEEVLRVGSRARALVLSLTATSVEAISLDHDMPIREGDRVQRTGRAATISVGDGLLGRAIDPMGRPLDGMPLSGRMHAAPLDRPAPGIADRAHVHRPLFTGTLAVDAMFAIGRGQRELVVGEEGSGKTALALDAMVRQKDTGVVCIWVAIGRRRAETWQIIETLRRAHDRWVVVAAFEDMTPGLRYLAPYAGATVAEHFAARGEHALVVYDELTAHAVAWRELSLLLRRPPGREAYPGDVFYLHARLLERAAQLSPERGGGSITALPIAALEGGRLTSYIPTNLISITDGQIVLSRELFAAGQKPAIDAGLSVSRVGTKAQPQAMKELAGMLRLDYASFLELEAFSSLGTRLEAATARRLDLGRRIRMLLRAPRLAPLGVFDEIVRLLIAREHEHLLLVPESEVGGVATELTQFLRERFPAAAVKIDTSAVLTDADAEMLRADVRTWVDRRYPKAPDAG